MAKLSLTDQFHFGKHKGQTVSEVLASNPGYISWLHGEDPQKFHSEVLAVLANPGLAKIKIGKAKKRVAKKAGRAKRASHLEAIEALPAKPKPPKPPLELFDEQALQGTPCPPIGPLRKDTPLTPAYGKPGELGLLEATTTTLDIIACYIPPWEWPERMTTTNTSNEAN